MTESREPWELLRGMFEQMMLVQLASQGLDTIGCQVEWRTDHSDPKATRAEIRLIYPDGAHECRLRASPADRSGDSI